MNRQLAEMATKEQTTGITSAKLWTWKVKKYQKVLK
jgi:hypothetical protein